MLVKVVHPVTNAAKMGPGHSCFEVQGTMYTFEGKGWRICPWSAYKAENRASNRPLIVQHLVRKVDGQKAIDYVHQTIKGGSRFNTYGYSGICSSQVARALHFAIPGGFPGGAPGGIEDSKVLQEFKPSDIYRKLKKAELMTHYEVIWKEPDNDFTKDHFRSCIRTFIGETWRPQILTREDLSRYAPTRPHPGKI